MSFANQLQAIKRSLDESLITTWRTGDQDQWVAWARTMRAAIQCSSASLSAIAQDNEMLIQKLEAENAELRQTIVKLTVMAHETMQKVIEAKLELK